ncbi:MAG: ATP-binding cassette domain-containing protein, partial [Bacteroidetes bacterium]|nr:ATP-binding cassette domain-containing protein [Bacteroidota bacterium]
KKDRSLWKENSNYLMKKFKFHQYEEVLVSNLSGGTKQKLNFSLSILHFPDILILDEPYSGFDWETYLNFWDFSKEQKDKGKSLLIVSHFVYDKQKFDKIYKLKNGVLECA